MATEIPKIEKYIREMIAADGGSFNREAILQRSKEWMQNFPVEFNSVLNMIEAEGRNVECDEMDDSTPSIEYDFGFTNDLSSESVAYFHQTKSNSNITNIIYEYKYADDSIDDSTPSVANYEEYNGDIPPDHMSYVDKSPMESDQIDSSPCGYQDDDFETYTPLQRSVSMSYAQPR
jgi:hypothetical protein